MPKSARNTAPLVPNPVPTRTADYVLVNECNDNWDLAPRSLTDFTEAQVQCLGRLYDWKYIRGYDDWAVPQKMLKTNDSVIAPLRQKGLVRRRHGGPYYYITGMGRRVYELCYWWRNHKLETMRTQRAQEAEARRAFRYHGSLTRT